MRSAEEEFGPRLPMTLITASSADDAFPAQGLERHTARTRGWHSGKMAEFPVELGFAFDGLAEVSCVRLLAHESKIPSKIDLFVYTPTEAQVAAQEYPPFEEAEFRRLGYITFSANEERNFAARELKTVRIRARLLYLKLVVRGCHANSVNMFNQAGLVALDLHGSLLVPFPRRARAVLLHDDSVHGGDALDAEVELTELTPAKAPSTASGARAGAASGDASGGGGGGGSVRQSRPGSAALSRDGKAFDEVTAQRIRQLKLHKAKAVAEEDYDLAKAIKEQIDQLAGVGEKIAELEERKRVAVEQEDYDVAKMLKRQIDDLRNPRPAQPRQPSPPPHQAAPHHPAPAPANPYYGGAHSTAGDSPPRGAQGHYGNDDVPAMAGSANPHPAPTEAAPVPFDERPAIAQGAPQPAEFPDETPAAGAHRHDALGPSHGNDDKVATASGNADAETGGIVVTSKPTAAGASVPVETPSMEPWERLFNKKILALAGDEAHAPPLDAPKVKEYQEYTTTFGLYCCSCLFAKRWQLRDAALRAIVSPDGFAQLTSGVRPPNQGAPHAVLQMTLNYLDGKTTGVNDSISQVFFSVCDAIKAIVSDELQGASVVAAVTGLSSLLPALMLKAGDSNQRVREKAQATLVMLAMSPVGPERVSAAALHDPQEKNKRPLNYRVHAARLAVTKMLLGKFGLSKKDHRTGLTAETVTHRLCVPLLTHASGDVRDAAVQLIVLLHDHVPAAAMQKLLGDVKPAQMAVIDEQIAARGGGGGKGREAELASSSISVEKGGQHPVLEAARQAKGGGASAAQEAPAPTAQQKRQQQQQQEREAAERAAKTCQFCGKYDKRFTDELLDAHYAKSCPMLINCPLCHQVVEIPTLQPHLIGECNRSTAVRQCPTCREAVPVGEFDDHVAASACIPASAQYHVCPLCHDKLPPTDDGWDDHLLKAPGCPQNPRRYDGGDGSEFK